MAAYHLWTKTQKFQNNSCSCFYQIIFLCFSNIGNKIIFNIRNQKSTYALHNDDYDKLKKQLNYKLKLFTGLCVMFVKLKKNTYSNICSN